MIKSIVPAFCDLRGSRKAIIQIEIDSFESTPAGTNYVVKDYAISYDEEGNLTKQLINTKSVFYSAEKINQLNVFLESIYEYTGMSKIDRDWTKVKQGLLIDTQTNLYEDGLTIYRLTPNNWELCEV
ncbi:hypothetical protein GJU43_14910 [Flavobacterium sp. LC2016-23]|uniref:hypothetical protein n=1 Tax=Flavobacterium sp. LC2016-23 TaxID=2666330 RepID=UPI0012B0E098|nr:hypothetical protein [Flavobacterium sp. LC2016-23]MRX40577.1 hypothetical protein [Flavobacterium sp. LC2016-23]